MKVLLLLRSENSDEENEYYIKAIKKFGGDIVFLEDTVEEEKVYKVLNVVDGVLLPGGDNVGKLDFLIIDYAFKNDLRLLGICQGMQSMALWKSKKQLLSIGSNAHYSDKNYVHSVFLEDGVVKNIYGKSELLVNSHHFHKVLESVMFKVVGYSNDGIVEAIENSYAVFQVGVQWHPERMIDYDENSRVLFRKFLL